MKQHHYLLAIIALLIASACTSHPVQSAFFDVKGKVKSIEEINYEARLTEDQIWQQGPVIESSPSNQYLFDQKGRVTSINTYFDGLLVSQLLRQYDRTDNVSALQLDQEGNLDSEVRTILDSKQKKVFETYLPSRQLKSRSTQYFEKGENVRNEVIAYDRSGEVLHTYSAYQEHYPDGTISAIEIVFPDSEEVQRSKIEYLDYDERGNWIRKTTIPEGDGEAQIQVRNIEYYK